VPQTVYDVGDPIKSRLKLGVVPDVTTSASVVVYRPDGTAIAAPPVSAWENVDEKTATFYATNDGTAGASKTLAVGDWVVIWTVTGTGASTAAKVYNVRALPEPSNIRPDWAPFLSDVADYVPRLTVDMVTPGSATEYGTFNGSTTPTDEQAQRLIDKAVASIEARFGELDVAFEPMAKTVASLRAAAAIARAYPRGPDDLSTAEQLDARADAEMAVLIEAVGSSGVIDVTGLLPQYAFPEPQTWYLDDWYESAEI
jgi:hypothetical protein